MQTCYQHSSWSTSHRNGALADQRCIMQPQTGADKGHADGRMVVGLIGHTYYLAKGSDQLYAACLCTWVLICYAQPKPTEKSIPGVTYTGVVGVFEAEDEAADVFLVSLPTCFVPVVLRVICSKTTR